MSSTSRKLLSIKNAELKDLYNKIEPSSEEEILLLNAPSETDNLYRLLEVPSEKEYVAETLKDVTEVKAYENLFEGCVAVKGSHIKAMCDLYYLKALKLNNIKGYLSKEGVEQVASFLSKFDKEPTSSSFYILAGRECFQDSYRGKEVKTFIIFYMDGADSRYNEQLEVDSTVMQISSSGNDWSDLRFINKYVDKNVYYDNTMSNLMHISVSVILPMVASIICLIVGFNALLIITLLFFLVGFLSTIAVNQNYNWNYEQQK